MTETNKQHIMVLDDEADITASLKMILEDAEYRVTVCNQPLVALDIFKKAPDSFHLIISDFSMPVMKGDEFARAIKAANPRIPIIIVTGYSQNMLAEIQQVVKILQKPFNVEDLLLTIQETLDQ